MSNLIKKVKIDSFRSVYNQTINCDSVNVFSGQNDTGKSNVLRALNLFFNGQTDFQTNFKFSEDYNKFSLARAQRMDKGKQQVKIRIYLNPPKNYKTLKDEKEVWVERSFDRYNKSSERFSNDRKKAQINRLLNKIKFVYVPALKGENVLQYLLSLIGDFELINEDDIEVLNDKIRNRTSDLREILNKAGINIDTSFGLPTLLADFWEKLAVETQHDNFEEINEYVKESGQEKGLNPSNYKIPLITRGEGIKSKYIPPLLEWLQNNDNKHEYIWGVDEPENSLEFKLSEELSQLYYSWYGKKTQIFLTSHSLAFLNPKQKYEGLKLFRALKDNMGSTYFQTFDDLYKEQNRYEFFDEIGALEVQKGLMDKYRQLEAEKIETESLLNQLKESTKPALLTEGKTDKKIIETAWEKCYNREIPFEIHPAGREPDEERRSGGAKDLSNTLQLTANYQKRKVIGVFDNDTEGINQFNGLKKGNKFVNYDQEGLIVKHQNKDIYGLLLPTPNFRTKFTQCNDVNHKYLEIEHLFPDNVLTKYHLVGTQVPDSSVFEINGKNAKKRFANQRVQNLSPEKFTAFKNLFERIENLIT